MTKYTTKDVQTVAAVDVPTLAPGTIAFHTPEGGPMLVIDRDRFLVRGVEVPQGEWEAQQVYEALVRWMGMVGQIQLPGVKP